MTVPPGILKRWDQEGPGQQATSVGAGEGLCVGQVSQCHPGPCPVPSSPIPLPPPSAGAKLQLPPSPSRNQSLRVASEPGGGGQVNIRPRGPGLPRLLHLPEPCSSSTEPRQKPPGLAPILVCPGDTCVCGVGKWTRAGTHLYSTAGTFLF